LLAAAAGSATHLYINNLYNIPILHLEILRGIVAADTPSTEKPQISRLFCKLT
jgi:hypothetical protein